MNGPEDGERLKETLNVTAGLADALDKAGIDIEIATNASIILAAQFCARLPNHDKEILEYFRRTFKTARRRFRESQN